ncbi:probetacellulin isoform X3 [Lampris incognitus]|uniref:probetacellulin isoform X3 n=1 Tax=Lampris incognitus TaxID=2546036 RepID=UPI0024B4B05F|nr:probetacellulin isoform X3 [Lampris incognitus]
MTYRVYVGIVTALALCKYSLAEWNATEDSANRTVSSCHHHGNQNNCTDSEDFKETGEWNGHFTKCPKDLKHYCIHGACRYIKEQKIPSCRCDRGFIGSRCEYVDLGWQIGEQRQIIIVCVITGLVFLILLIVFICICSHRRYRLCRRRGRRREEPRNGTEKLNMIDTSGAHRALTPDSTETPHTNAV